MKYLRKFESNEPIDVLYQNITGIDTHIENVLSSDFFRNLTMVDFSDKTLVEINKSIHNSTLSVKFSKTPPYMIRIKDDWEQIVGADAFVGNGGDRNAIAYFRINIIEFSDEWFFVDLFIIDRKSNRLFFKCDTIAGIIQVLNKYIEL